MTTLRRHPLAEQAVEVLLERITAGEWPVGARIPGETTLAGELGVGRSTVREAIRELAGKGVLHSRQGAGVYVASAELAQDWETVLRKANIAHIVEVRMAIECEAALLAASRRTPADLRALNKTLSARDSARERQAAYIDADIAFHGAIVTAAHNPALGELFHTVTPRIRQAMTELLRIDGGETPHDHEAHAAIVAAIRARDPDGAWTAARAHLGLMAERLGPAGD